jgi:hypothetical protein
MRVPAAPCDARSPLADRDRVCHNARLMGHRLDSATTSATSAALSGFAYAYAYPFAWRFS